jgi:hypothetical protein
MRKLAVRVLYKLANIIDRPRPAVSEVAPHSTVIKLEDEYLAWLKRANAGMLHPGNPYCFDYAIANLPSEAPIVEIGSFCGLSTNLITYLKGQHNIHNPLITCDKWMFENVQGSMVGNSQISHAAYREFVKASYIRNIEMFSEHDLPFTLEMFSDEFFAAWRDCQDSTDVLGRQVRLGGAISFCYIDGNHTYECSKRDFENVDQFLEPGGFILFDDSADGSSWEVNRVAQEVECSGRYDLVIKNPNYLFRKGS